MSGERSIPNRGLTDQPRFKILINNEALPQSLPVYSLNVWKSFNRISSARFLILDGDSSEENFEWSSSDYFIPGNEIEIKAGYQRNTTTIFKGIVVSQKMKVRSYSDPYLIVECRDKAYKMTLARKNRYYFDMTDSDIISQISAEYGINEDLATTTITHKQMVQYRSSDWDFLVMRAEANGMFVLTDDGTLKMSSPDVSAEAEFSVIFGASLLEFDGEMDGRIQAETTEAKGWDYSNQETVSEKNGSISEAEISDKQASQIAQDAGYEKEYLINSGLKEDAELSTWAHSAQHKKVNAKIRGRAKFQGTSSISPGKVLELQGLGSRMNGKTLVWGVRHEIADGGWTSDAELGIPDKFFHEEHKVADSQASGLLPPVHGLETGIVTALEGDPDGEPRIKVKIPTLDMQDTGTWARISTLDAGSNRGSYFLPEIGDEVIIGFINDDPRNSIVLGMLHSSAKPAPSTHYDDNHEKGFLTRSGMKVWFNDEKVDMVLETPNGNIITLSDEKGKLSLQDENGNSMVMESAGITLDSPGDISIKASGDVNIEGRDINAKALSQLKAKGSGGAELSSDAILNINGSLIKIN